MSKAPLPLKVEVICVLIFQYSVHIEYTIGGHENNLGIIMKNRVRVLLNILKSFLKMFAYDVMN